MSTNTKSSPLIYLIIAVVVIFIAAIIYKNLKVDNSEQVYVPVVETVKTPKITDKKEYDFTPIADIPTSDENPYANLTKEEREKLISKKLNKYTMFRTPEEVMEVIYRFKELGREEEAEEYIDFLIERFPDYEMN